MQGIVWGMPTLLELGGLDRQVEACRDLGLRLLELNMDLPEMTSDRLRPAGLRDLSRRAGVAFTAHLPEALDLAAFQQPLLGAARRFCARTIRWAGAARVRLLNAHINPGVYFTLPQGRVFLHERYEDDFRNRLLASTLPLAAMARRAGTVLALENAGAFALPSTIRVLDDLLAGAPDLRLTWDTGHDGSSGHAHRAVLMRHQARIVHMHLHDYRGRSNHLPLGTGELDLEQATAFARSHGLSVVIEVKALEELERSVRFLLSRGYPSTRS